MSVVAESWRLPHITVRFTVSAAELGQVVPWGVTYLGVTALHKKTRGAGIKIGVADTGIDATHPDFAGAILAAKDFTNSPHGTDDQHGHGTHTAGTIGSRDNGQGILPVAPDCQLLIAKVLGDDGSGSSESIRDGLHWLVDGGAQIISMSLGSPQGDDVMHEGLEYAVKHGVLVIGAAGNESTSGVGYPAAWNDLAEAIAAVDQQGRVAGFSSIGEQVDVCAPGVHVVSCWPGNRYAYLDGTSMACPHVAGGMALVQAYRAQNGLPLVANQADLNKAIHATAKTTLPVPSPSYGYGIFNPAAMLDYGATAPPTGQKLRVPIGDFLGYSWELAGTPLVNK